MELFSDKPGDEGLPGAKRRIAMVAVMMATSMSVFDGSMVNVALPQLAKGFQVSAASAIWVANGYLLTVAMSLAIFAALAARIGFRRQFTFGLGLFTLASLGCTLANSLESLVAMRLLQGVGGAAMLSISPAILRSIFPNRLLGRVLGVNALMVASCTAIAPVIGGTLISLLSWRWLFAINVPVGLLAIVLVARVVPDNKQTMKGRFDFAGALLSAATLGGFIMAARSFSSSSAGQSLANMLTSGGMYAGCALICAVLFIWRQRRATSPLLPLTMFASRRFSLAALTSMCSFTSQGMTFIALPFLFQTVYGYSAFTSAMLFTPWPLGIILAAPIAGRLADRYPAPRISTCGLVIFALGLWLLASLSAQASLWDMALRSLVCGIGFGCFQSPNNREMLGNVARELSGYASGVLAIMRTFGQCLGAALVGIVVSLWMHANTSSSLTRAAEMQAVHACLWVAFAATLLAAFVSASRLRL